MPLRPSPFRLRQPWLVLAAALLLTVLAAALAARYVQAREQAAFDAAIEASLGRLASRLDGHVALLRATRAFLQSSPAPVGHPAYETYVRRLRLGPDYPGMQGVGWSPRIDRADLAAFERAARAEGLAGFHVWPAGPRAPHFSILYLEPPDARNLAALGFDMSTEPVRAAAMDSARDSGALAMSGVVTLKQEIDQHKEAGFLVYVPVYGGDEPPATLEARRERLSGFVYAPLRSGDFFAGVLDARLAARVVAGDAGARTTLFEAVPGAPFTPAATRTMLFGGQRWTLEFAPRPALRPLAEGLLVPVVVVGGALLSALLFALAQAQARDLRVIERISAARAQALEAEQAQRRVAESLSAFAVSAGSATDVAEVLHTLLDAALRLTGAGDASFVPVEGIEVPAVHVGAADGAANAFARAGPGAGAALLRAALAVPRLRVDDLAASAFAAGFAAPAPASVLGVCLRTRERGPLGCLFLGHPHPGGFGVDAERRLEGLAAEAAVVIENVELRRRERAAHEATEAQKRLLESFVGIASHDLRNPLNTIIVSVTLLERMPQLAAELQPVARRIRRGAERALRLVRDLLDFTQVRLGRRLPIDPAPTDLAAVAREVVDELRAAHPARCIELQVEADVLGVWDADRMAQVLANLLGNALAHGDPAAPVVLHVGGDADAVELAVHNQGPPIPEALRARLFEPLQQGERRGRGAHGGIGLGLFIVEQIVRAHRGSVGVESTAQGTTFRVRLPRGVE